MAVDAFIWFENPGVGGVPMGETFDKTYKPKNAFEIKDFSFGVENPTTIGSATGGAGAGKIKFNEFTIKKTTDQASALFFKNCCTGSHYANVVIEMRKAGGSADVAGKAFLRFKFGTVFTTKIDWSGPGDEGPEETITFVYGKLGVTYWLQTTDPGTGQSTGLQGAPKPGGWDQVRNTDWTSDNMDGPVG
jgi:type VI secretion system secreted protein Hcp